MTIAVVIVVVVVVVTLIIIAMVAGVITAIIAITLRILLATNRLLQEIATAVAVEQRADQSGQIDTHPVHQQIETQVRGSTPTAVEPPSVTTIDSIFNNELCSKQTATATTAVTRIHPL